MKKGIWLSTNFFVMLVIALVALGMGFYLVQKFFTTADEIRENVDTQTEKEIERLMHDGDRISIPFNRKTLRKGQGDAFGIGIANPLDKGPTFTIDAAEGPWIMEDGTAVDPGNFEGIGFLANRQIAVENNEFEIVAFPVDVSREVLPGTYILNVYICDGSYAEGDCAGATKDNWYDGYVHKLYVEVP